MKHLFLILFGALLLCSCQDCGIESELTPSPCQKQEENNKNNDNIVKKPHKTQ